MKDIKVTAVIIGTEVIRLEACPLCGNLEVKFKKYKPYDGYMNEGENYQIHCECGVVYERSASQVSLSDFCCLWNFSRRVPTNYEWIKQDEVIKAQADKIRLLEQALLDKQAQLEYQKENAEKHFHRQSNTLLFLSGTNKNLKKKLATAKADAIKDFGHFLIDRAEEGSIRVCDVPDLVKEWEEKK